MAKAGPACILGSLLIAALLVSAPIGAEESGDHDKNWVPDRDEVIDTGGVAYGVTFGNIIYPGFKAATMILAAPQAGLAWLLSLGDTEQARTIWEAQTEGPYYISPTEARKSLGLDAEPEASYYEERELTE